jgi:2-polyprenyl-3-methyl-5-hydroxy-6-metoxy-1,4-benzoquinol methylase
MIRNIADNKIYLQRMAKPLAEKLKIIKFLPENAKNVIDVGCADGTVTLALSSLFPKINFLGIDLNDTFIKLANRKKEKISNVNFERVYLRELLARKTKYEAVIFCSVLHEFFTYGQGISSVLKALADAHELLKKDGVIIIRDMILNEDTKKTNWHVKEMVEKIKKNMKYLPYFQDFEKYFGSCDNHYLLNHFLLKYWYRENWSREGKENYVPVTTEQYEQIFMLLGMKLQYKESYLITFLAEKWIQDFSLSEEEISCFTSTGLLSAQKK